MTSSIWRHKQGGLSLVVVAVAMAALAALAMVMLFSMRFERNILAESYAKIVGKPGATAGPGLVPAISAVSPSASPAPLKRCVIDGKTVISNTDCAASNPTTRAIVVHETRGIESPKAPPVPPQEATPQAMRDKIIENATR